MPGLRAEGVPDAGPLAAPVPVQRLGAGGLRPPPKFRYDARRAHETALERLSSSRSGISVSRRELDEMLPFAIPLIRDNGLSPEAI